MLGDLVLGNKNTAIAGIILEALGVFALCFSEVGLYVGLVLLSIGGGLYLPNLYASVGKLYLQKSKFFDSVYTFLYGTVMLGALIGPLSLLSVQQSERWITGFILVGLLMILAVVPIIFTKNLKNDSITTDEQPPPLAARIVLIPIALLFVGIFWGVYDLTATHANTLQYHFSEASSLPLPRTFWSSASSMFIIPICILLTVLWLFLKIPQFTKLALGFMFANLSFIILVSIPESPAEGQAIIFILSLVLFNFAEILISPTINSILARYTNPKYLGILMSLNFAPASFFMWLITLFSNEVAGYTLQIMIAGCILFSIVTSLLVLFAIIKRFTSLKNV
ncbi:MAG: MFS transporter [Bacteroidota bacterium]